MTQNTSHAVMAQRHEAHDSLDYFPTPPWATRALFEHVIGSWPGHLGWDPACGEGHMFRPMCEYMLACAASDIHVYGWDHVVHDFLMPFPPDGIAASEWIITNPPFRLGEQFVERALQLATHGVAILVRTSFIEGVDRYSGLFKSCAPAIVAQFSERVIIHKGILRDPRRLYWDPEAINKKTGEKGAWKKPSTATSYCWLVWTVEKTTETKLIWIPPCRKRLERDEDYR